MTQKRILVVMSEHDRDLGTFWGHVMKYAGYDVYYAQTPFEIIAQTDLYEPQGLFTTQATCQHLTALDRNLFWHLYEITPQLALLIYTSDQQWQGVSIPFRCSVILRMPIGIHDITLALEKVML